MSLRSVHGKFLSAQPDGSAQWNRDVASVWEYFHLEKRQGGKITLKGAHGMYVSAQPDGSVQINRKAAPPGGWEDLQFLKQDDTGQGAAHAPESIEILEDAPGKPAQMTDESTKNTAKIAFVIGIALFGMGLPLLIIGSISTDEDRLAMLIPGAVMFCTGIFVVIATTKKRLGSGKRSTTSEQDPASKIVRQHKVGNINRFERDDTALLISDDDLEDEGDTNEPFWEIN